MQSTILSSFANLSGWSSVYACMVTHYVPKSSHGVPIHHFGYLIFVELAISNWLIDVSLQLILILGFSWFDSGRSSPGRYSAPLAAHPFEFWSKPSPTSMHPNNKNTSSLSPQLNGVECLSNEYSLCPMTVPEGPGCPNGADCQKVNIEDAEKEYFSLVLVNRI